VSERQGRLLQMWEAYRPALAGKRLSQCYFLLDWMPEDTLKWARADPNLNLSSLPVPPVVAFKVHPFAPHTTPKVLCVQIRAEGHVLYYEYRDSAPAVEDVPSE